MGGDISINLENGNKAIVREIAREVIREQQEHCVLGTENRMRIDAIEETNKEFKETTKLIFVKLDETAAAHDKQWRFVYNAVVGLLISVVAFFLIYVFHGIFK